MQSCPECGSELVVKHKGANSFLACSAYPSCQFTQGLREQSDIEPEALGVDCPQCGQELQLKSGRYGLFVGCSAFPDCDFVAEPDKGTGTERPVHCPECAGLGKSGYLRQKTSRKGKRFYACENYPSCDFSVNFAPVESRCPSCQYPILVRKQQGGTKRLLCVHKSCGYKSEPL